MLPCLQISAEQSFSFENNQIDLGIRIVSEKDLKKMQYSDDT